MKSELLHSVSQVFLLSMMIAREVLGVDHATVEGPTLPLGIGWDVVAGSTVCSGSGASRLPIKPKPAQLNGSALPPVVSSEFGSWHLSSASRIAV